MEKQIYNALVNFDFSQAAVLCSLVDWKGSVPRRDYPVMLVLEDGTVIGTVGGGGMEHQVIEAAKRVLQTSQSVLKNYDLSGTL
ncbi:MAG: XdhC family protein, partial [Candidatus Marinimicrobia bacterium]|nr:XdhC family protein [Candidatus Neomarinimicrobiota bacterium]